MKNIILLLAAMGLFGCGHFPQVQAAWDQLEPAEQVAVGVGAALVVGAVIVRNGEHSQCYAHHSVNTDCVTGHK